MSIIVQTLRDTRICEKALAYWSELIALLGDIQSWPMSAKFENFSASRDVRMHISVWCAEGPLLGTPTLQRIIHGSTVLLNYGVPFGQLALLHVPTKLYI